MYEFESAPSGETSATHLMKIRPARCVQKNVMGDDLIKDNGVIKHDDDITQA
jgi:hypothetical protein